MPSQALCSECEDLKREIQSLKMIISNRERAFKEESIKTALINNQKLMFFRLTATTRPRLVTSPSRGCPPSPLPWVWS